MVATNAPLDKAAVNRMATNAHDGMARAISPIHTLYDGDTVFAMSTGVGPGLEVSDPAAAPVLNSVFNAGADTLSRAIAKAMLSAESVGSTTSYCDRYPSACADAGQIESWRSAGSAPEVTPSSFRRASKALEVAPVPPPDGQARSEGSERAPAPSPDRPGSGENVATPTSGPGVGGGGGDGAAPLVWAALLGVVLVLWRGRLAAGVRIGLRTAFGRLAGDGVQPRTWRRRRV